MATLFPALIVIALEELLVVFTDSFNEIFPVKVSTEMVPEAKMPLLVPTVPMVNPPLASVKLKEPSLVPLSPPAIVATLLLVLFKVKVPVPCKPREVADNAAVCVTAPVACKFIALLVEVNAALIAKAPPKIEMGPAMDVAVLMVTFEVFVSTTGVEPFSIPSYRPMVRLFKVVGASISK